MKKDSNPQTITQLLQQHNAGDPNALNRVIPLVYDELSNLAHRYMLRERNNHTLDTRAVVHDAYFRLVGDTEIEWKDRRHFYVIMARTMRRILCDYARKYQSAKRGGGHTKFNLTSLANVFSEEHAQVEDHTDLLLSINQALDKLAKKDEQLAHLVELRFFYGMTIPEVAEAMGVSARSVNRDWQIARRELRRTLRDLRP